jgi:MFS family permease
MGLSASEISLLLAIWSASTVILEVPTGILADHWNRRNMLIIGNISKALCYVLWLFSDGFALVAMGFLLWGLSEAFCSGSEEALLFDNLKLEGKEHEFDEVYGKGQFYLYIGVAISGLSGGFLAMAFGMEFVLKASIFTVLISAGISAVFREVNLYTADTNSLVTLRESAAFCVKSKKLLIMIILSVFVIITAGILDEYDPLIAEGYGLNLGFIGIWGCLRYLLEAIGGRIAYKLRAILTKLRIRDRFTSIWVLCLIAGILLGLSGWVHSIILVPLYGLFYLLMSSAAVLHEDYIQQQIYDQGRSTVHSLISLMNNLYAILFFGFLSAVLMGTDLRRVLIFIAIYIIVICLILKAVYSILNVLKKE